jgi:predicted Rossmann fold flavoprotein
MDKTNHFDVVVIGAGAAGLMSAVHCARSGLEVLLLDGQKKIGAKILMSGGTRCNVTNRAINEKDYQSEQPRFVRNILNAFPSSKAIKFFEDAGVSLVVEEGGKVYPSTHSGKTILECLLKESDRCGLRLETGRKVKSILFKDQLFFVRGDDFQFIAKTVVLSTGGLSYPSTGSDGIGYKIAQHFGHNLIKTTPALTPLLTDDLDWKSLSGVAFDCKLTLKSNNVKEISYTGPFLFTHFGFSGLVVLDISRHWIRCQSAQNRRLAINFLPHLKEEEFRQRLIDYTQHFPRRLLKSFLEDLFSERLTQMILRKSKILIEQTMNQLKKEEREKLILFLYEYNLPVIDVMGYGKAEVTAGGIDLKEVDPVSLESKLCPGLFLAGEILDVDGRIGGFNFQWAWSSGVAAAKGVIKKLK